MSSQDPITKEQCSLILLKIDNINDNIVDLKSEVVHIRRTILDGDEGRPGLKTEVYEHSSTINSIKESIVEFKRDSKNSIVSNSKDIKNISEIMVDVQSKQKIIMDDRATIRKQIRGSVFAIIVSLVLAIIYYISPIIYNYYVI